MKSGAGRTFAARLLAWFSRHGRHDLPWQHPREPYRVWLAEVMLQQTQVATVVPYFERFVARFPHVDALASAPLDDVLALWSGLGYYARARNLHRCAGQIIEDHGGAFPRDLAALIALPGIGRSTGAAILAQAFGQRHAILDGNVRRVLARHGAVAGWSGAPDVQRKLWALAESHLPRARLADYTQAIMDVGATVCLARRPHCAQCPLRGDCQALQQDRVDEFPARRPRRERPSRSAHLLLIENDRGEILLERRPPVGIWGGLWSLPMIDGGDWRAHVESALNLQTRHPRAAGDPVPGEAADLPSIHHAFTHFDLTLRPLHLRADVRPSIADAPNQRWTTITAAAALGLPAPVRRLLQSLESAPCPAPSTA